MLERDALLERQRTAELELARVAASRSSSTRAARTAPGRRRPCGGTRRARHARSRQASCRPRCARVRRRSRASRRARRRRPDRASTRRLPRPRRVPAGCVARRLCAGCVARCGSRVRELHEPLRARGAAGVAPVTTRFGAAHDHACAARSALPARRRIPRTRTDSVARPSRASGRSSLRVHRTYVRIIPESRAAMCAETVPLCGDFHPHPTAPARQHRKRLPDHPPAELEPRPERRRRRGAPKTRSPATAPTPPSRRRPDQISHEIQVPAPASAHRGAAAQKPAPPPPGNTPQLSSHSWI